MRAETPRPVRLTATQLEILRMFHDGAAEAIIRKRGPRQMCRIVPAMTDARWHKRHSGRPVQEHSLAALVKVGALARTEEGDWIVWRLRNAGHS